MAGRIPRDFIDNLLARVDVVDVVNTRVPLKKKGREYMACCPFHNEKTPSFTVSPTKQFYHCFGCGAHGSAVSFLMEYEHLSFVEAIESLAHSLGIDVPHEAQTPQQVRKQKVARGLYELMEEAGQYFTRQLQHHAPARQYIKQREIDQNTAQRFGLGYSSDAWDALTQQFGRSYGEQKLLASGLQIKNDAGRVYDRFRDRLMFPIRDRKGRVIGFGGRVLGEGTPKYLNSPETDIFHKGYELYGLYEARQHTRQLERLVVVEGYMDVIALAQFGVTYAVATLGTAITGGDVDDGSKDDAQPEVIHNSGFINADVDQKREDLTQRHIQQLFSTVSEVVFCFDGDRAGKQAAWRALENAMPELNDGREIRFLFLPAGEDPDSQVRKIGKDAFEQSLRDDSLTLSDYLLVALKAQFNTASREGRSRLVDHAMGLLAVMPETLLKAQIINELATIAGVQPEMIRRSGAAKAVPQALPKTTQPANADHGVGYGAGADAGYETSYETNYDADYDAQYGQAEYADPAEPGRRRSRLNDQEVSRTPVRYAITLLLNYPQLVEFADNPEQLVKSDLPGMNLLVAMVETAEENPNIHSAGMLEHFRGTQHEKVLLKLAKWQPQDADVQILQREVQDCFRQIRRKAQTMETEALLHRLQSKPFEELSAQEKHDLRALLEQQR